MEGIGMLLARYLRWRLVASPVQSSPVSWWLGKWPLRVIVTGAVESAVVDSREGDRYFLIKIIIINNMMIFRTANSGSYRRE